MFIRWPLDFVPRAFPCPGKKTRPPRPQEIESGLLGTGGKIWAEEWAKMRQAGYWRRPLLPDPLITARTAERYSLGETFHQKFSRSPYPPPSSYFPLRVSSCFPGTRGNVGRVWKTWSCLTLGKTLYSDIYTSLIKSREALGNLKSLFLPPKSGIEDYYLAEDLRPYSGSHCVNF